jgi:DNA recombination protein RmuC
MDQSLLLVLFSAFAFVAGIMVYKFMVVKNHFVEKDLLSESKAKELALAQNLENLRTEIQEEKKQVEVFRLKNLEYEKERVGLESEKRHVEQKVLEITEQKTHIEKQIQDSIKNLTQSIFEEKNKKFEEGALKELEKSYKPLLDSIKDFDKHLKEGTQERSTLKSEIHQLMSLNQVVKSSTEELTSALKGSSKLQGDWGENILENILKSLGMSEERDYFKQGIGLGLKDSDNNRKAPDFIVRLPEDRHLIIDSKVSMSPYMRLLEAEEPLRTQCVRELAQAVKTHLRGLKNKEYEKLEGLKTSDMVVMFMPVEDMYKEVLRVDHTIMEEAFKSGVLLAYPSNLYGILKAVSYIMSIEKQNRHTEQIVAATRNMSDKLIGFLDDLKKVGSQLDSAKATYDQAFAKLQSGKGNVIGQLEKIQLLGVKGKKEINFISEDSTEIN